MEVDKLMLDTLEDLSKENRDKFVFYLKRKVLETCDPIARSILENIECVKLVEKMTEKYGSDRSVELMIAILHIMGLYGEEERLKKKYGEVKAQLSTSGAASSSVTSSPAPVGERSRPATSGALPSVTVTALDGGTVNAPVITGCTVQGPMSLTFNK